MSRVIAGPQPKQRSGPKLTEDDVQLIRLLIRDGIPHYEIAEKFGITRVSVTNINTGYTWSHLPQPEPA